MFAICVIREVSKGDHQYVPVSEVPFLRADDVVFSGDFRLQSENLGPYGSHSRTICLPNGSLNRSRPCVLREVEPGDTQYVPVNEVPVISAGERMFAGSFRSQREKHGPYGSHLRTICLPAGELVERPAA